MYYHFAFLAISIALFGLSASGVYAYLRRRALERHDTEALLAAPSAVYAASTIVALFALVGWGSGQLLALEPRADAGDLALAAVPFFTGASSSRLPSVGWPRGSTWCTPPT